MAQAKKHLKRKTSKSAARKSGEELLMVVMEPLYNPLDRRVRDTFLDKMVQHVWFRKVAGLTDEQERNRERVTALIADAGRRVVECDPLESIDAINTRRDHALGQLVELMEMTKLVTIAFVSAVIKQLKIDVGMTETPKPKSKAKISTGTKRAA